MPNIVPQVPEQNPSQSELWLPRVANPFQGVWFNSQTYTDIPEQLMGWYVAQGFEVSNIRQDRTTVPPTNYYTVTKQGMQPLEVLLSLCNSYTVAANDARTANQVRYNQIVSNWTQMIDTSHEQFDAQTEEQNAQAGVYLADLDEYMSAIETLIADNRAQIVIDAEAARVSLDEMEVRLSDLETNAQDSAVSINTLLTEQETHLNGFISDYDTKLAELDTNFASHLANVLTQVASLDTVLDSHIAEYSQQFSILADNYAAHAADIEDKLAGVTANVDTYVADVAAILLTLESDYLTAEADLDAIKTQAGVLVANHASDYNEVLALLLTDYNSHASLARGFLTGLGATELARINEQFAASLSAQLQQLTNRGLFSSAMVTDITQRNHRDRDEQVQQLNDRLNREKLDNQHKLYEQQAAMRARTMDGQDRLHNVRQEVLRYQASLVTGIHGLLAESRNRVLGGKQAIFAAKDANAKYGVDVSSALYGRLQEVRQRTIDSVDRIYQLQDIFAKWENSESNRQYEQLQQIETQFLSSIERYFAAKQDVNRGEISQRDTLLTQLQGALSSLLSGKERYSSLLLQIASQLAEHKHRAIAERMNTAVQRLDGWKSIADQNRTLMAYQLDERNKLLVGLYSFVERREDVSPEWEQMTKMIAGLGDSAGGWLAP